MLLRSRRPWSFSRSPRSFIWSRSWRAQTNSAANTPKASAITSQPGPGVTIITTPSTSRVNPKSIFRNRFVCCRDFKSISVASSLAETVISCVRCRGPDKRISEHVDFHRKSASESACVCQRVDNRALNLGTLIHFREISCRWNARIGKRNLPKGRNDFLGGSYWAPNRTDLERPE
jgi:hypothetical protein